MSNRVDVELRCDRCGDETLATEDCYMPACSQCKEGRRTVMKRHDHVLTFAETVATGYVIR